MKTFTEAISTKCQTPNAEFKIEISDSKVLVEVGLPIKMDLTEAQAKLLELNIHNAMELVLAPFFNNYDGAV